MFSPDVTHLLARAADAYTPTLLLLALIRLVFVWRMGNKYYGAGLAYAILVVYGWMFIDKYFQLWAGIGLDYSTHTAASLALVMYIGIGQRWRYKALLGASLLSYGGLMFLLHYHSWSDMFTTAGVIGIFLTPLAGWRYWSPRLNP